MKMIDGSEVAWMKRSGIQDAGWGDPRIASGLRLRVTGSNSGGLTVAVRAELVEACLKSVSMTGSGLLSGNSHAADLQRRGGDTPAEFQVVANDLDVLEHFQEISRNGDLFDWISQFSILDPQSDHAT
jgi:hypothetical protein